MSADRTNRRLKIRPGAIVTSWTIAPAIKIAQIDIRAEMNALVIAMCGRASPTKVKTTSMMRGSGVCLKL